MSVNLKYKHQQKTFELMKEELNQYGKVAFSYPTGCGKSFPPLKYIEEVLKSEETKDSNILIVVPYNIIASQFRDYIKQYVDDGIKRLKDKKIMVITYAKLALLMKYSKNHKFDIGIFDEAQMLGATTYEPAFDAFEQQNEDVRVIAMTATPERMDGRNMLYEKFGKHVVYEMSLTEALSGSKEGEVILKAPKYFRVISQLKPLISKYEERINSIDDSNRKSRISEKYRRLSSIVNNAPSIQDVIFEAFEKRNGKYIVYCKNRKEMFQMIERCQKIFGKVNTNIQIDYLLSKDNEGSGKTLAQNLKTLKEFEQRKYNDSLQLLFCIDMLNLGKHIDGEKINGEVFFRETKSAQVYKQQMGRIMIPEDNGDTKVIVDAVNNWLRQIDAFYELVQALESGNQNNKNNNYELFKLMPEEIEFLDLLREIGEELNFNCFGTYEQIVDWLETHDGKMPQGNLKQNGLYIKMENLEEERLDEVRLYGRWLNCPERKMLDKYIGVEIEDIPELDEMKEKIQKLRSYGLGLRLPNTYERLMEWLDMHDGKMPKAASTFRDEDGNYIKSEDMTEKQLEEKKLYDAWVRSKEKKLLEKYKEVPVEEIPESEEMKEKIKTLREYGLGITLYEEYINFLEKYNRTPREGIRRNGRTLGKDEITEEQRYEKSLHYRWGKSEIRKISDIYSGQPIELVPIEFREKISELRKFGIGTRDVRPLIEKMVDFAKEHKGRTPYVYAGFSPDELPNELYNERLLGNEWNTSKLKKMAEEYSEIELNKVPKEWRSQIRKITRSRYRTRYF